MPLSVLIWGGLVLTFAMSGALAARRFAAAIRAAGGTLLTDEERRELFFDQPIGSFPKIVVDDVAGLDQVLRRQSDRKAERWRRITLVSWAALLAVLFLPFIGRLFLPAFSSTSNAAMPHLVAPLAWIVAAFWVAQLWSGIVHRRRGAWLIVCGVGVTAGATAALITSSWLQ